MHRTAAYKNYPASNVGSALVDTPSLMVRTGGPRQEEEGKTGFGGAASTESNTTAED
jgi:hypothetical protein